MMESIVFWFFVSLLLFFESIVLYLILKKQIHSLSSPQSASNQLQSGSGEGKLRSKEIKHCGFSVQISDKWEIWFKGRTTFATPR